MTANVYNMRWPMPDESGVDQVWIPDRDETGGVYKLLDDNKMCAALGHNQFSEQIRELPVGCRIELADHQRVHYCTSPRPREDLGGDALEWGDWVDAVSPQCLTINDIQQFEPGQSYKLLVMDRNLGDVITQANTAMVVYQPEEFFRENTATYTHREGLSGTMIYHWRGGDSEPRAFEFELEYAPDCWYPLINGCLPMVDPQGFAKFEYPEPKHWSTFPSNIRVGWRGPLMLWSKVAEQSPVYFYSCCD
jgi:hypothetical protein